MFNIFKMQDENFKLEFDKRVAEFDNWFLKQVKEAQSMVPKVEDTKDSVTVTFKGPNVVTTITTNKDLLPSVLKDLGVELPKSATVLGAETEKRVTKQRKSSVK